MKQKKIYLFLILLIHNLDGQEKFVPKKNLNANELFGVRRNNDGKVDTPVTPQNKTDTSLGSRITSNRMLTSFTRTQTHANHPRGNALFPTEGQLSGLLDAFIESVEQDPYFITYFSKLHLVILNELYLYLMKIYTTFNLNRIMGKGDEMVWNYLENEQTQALNKKTMIVNHLINVIERQANGAITARFPALPKHVATLTGPLLMQHDYGADLQVMLAGTEERLFEDPQVKKHFKGQRGNYLDTFGKYLKFFNAYTQTIEQTDPVYGSKFVKHAKDIEKVITAQSPVVDHQKTLAKGGTSAATKELVKTLRSIKTINPPIFFYDLESLRGVKVIPAIAKLLPPNTQKIGWPAPIVQDAISGTAIETTGGITIAGAKKAYFEDANGNETTSLSRAAALFVNIPTLDRRQGNIFTQQMLKQPDWLNSYEGIILMLRACLGDYTVLFNSLLYKERILDPCVTCIISQAAQKAGIAVSNAQQEEACSTCNDFLKDLRAFIAGAEEAQPTPPPAIDPGGPDAPPPPPGTGTGVVTGL